jgi:thymidylate kinase
VDILRLFAASNVRPDGVDLIAVVGIDGSGKSTLSEALACALSQNGVTGLVSDDLKVFENRIPREAPPFLAEKVRERIGRYSKTSVSLGRYKIPKIAELLLRNHLVREIQKRYRPDGVVQDGSPLLNLVAWAGLYQPGAVDAPTCLKLVLVLSGQATRVPATDPVFGVFPELAILRRLRLTQLRLPRAVVLLDLDGAVAVERIGKRGGNRQIHETEPKLDALRDGYRLVCGVVRDDLKIPTLILDGRLERACQLDASLDFVSRICRKEGVNE